MKHPKLFKLRIEVPSEHYHIATEHLQVRCQIIFIPEDRTYCWWKKKEWVFHCWAPSLVIVQKGLDDLEAEFNKEFKILAADLVYP